MLKYYESVSPRRWQVAKIKKRTLRWTASESPQVVGYKLYWAEGGQVHYDCPSAKLGNTTEVVLPDDVESFAPEIGPVELGVSAVDELGNESDLITISAPYQFNIPQAPDEIWLEDQERALSAEDLEDRTSDPLEEAPGSGSLTFLEHNFEEDEQVRVHCIGHESKGEEDDSDHRESEKPSFAMGGGHHGTTS
jgi:hypothetical protein